MSRHELQPRPDSVGVTRAAVGWDPPLETYYAQVFTTREGEEEAIVWRGTSPRELATPADAIHVVAPYAIVPDDLASALAAEEAASNGRTDGPHQRRMKLSLFRKS